MLFRRSILVPCHQHQRNTGNFAPAETTSKAYFTNIAAKQNVAVLQYEYEYEICIALISQRNIRVQGSTSIKIYGYQHTTNKLKH